MGRKPTITREGLLDCAETIVRSGGPQALTIDSLAKAAGVSKGGVQYSFESKDALITALVERWTNAFDALLEPERPATPAEFIRRYLAALRSSQEANDAKMAGLLIAYMQNPENQRETREWYKSTLLRFQDDTAEARAARVAFLAVEGLFLMQLVGFDDAARRASLLDDVEAAFSHLLQLSPPPPSDTAPRRRRSR